MAALYPLRRLQLAKEASRGTPVTALWQMVGDNAATVLIPRYMSDYPRGVMAPVTGGGVPLSQSVNFVQTTDLSYEELWYHCMLGMGTGTVTGAGADKTWTFTPNLIGDPGIATATAEYAFGDGSATAFPYPGTTAYPLTLQSAYCFSTGWDVAWAFNGIATATYRLTGRAPTFAATTPTPVPAAAATVLNGRERIPGNRFKVYLDTTWAAMTGVTPTQLVGTVLNGRLSFDSGIDPDYTTDGRPDLSYTQLRQGRDRVMTLSLTMELNATSAAEVKAWVAQNANGGALAPNPAGGTVNPRFIRIESTSPNVLGASARRLRLDGCFVYTTQPAFSQQNKTELVTLALKSEYDPQSASSYQASFVHAIPAFT